jgi:hypothetical protein
VRAPDDDEQGTPQLTLRLVDSRRAVNDVEGGARRATVGS